MGIAFFVIAIILFIAFIGCLIAVAVGNEYNRFGYGIGATVCIGLAVVFYICASLTTVPIRTEGVPTSFGKPTGETYKPGLHWKAPWVKVTDIDNSTQIQEYRGDDCITVLIADGSRACISMTYRWSIKPGASDEVFAEYDKAEDDITTTVRKALVSTNIKASLNEAFADYNPLNIGGKTIDSNTTPEELAQIEIEVAPDYDSINQEVKENVEDKIKDVGDLIAISQITVSDVKLAESAQKKINDLNAAVLRTRVAIQDKATKQAEAEGFNLLNEALKNAEPTVIVSKCLDLLADGISAPVGFQCWPGTNGAVVVPSTK